MEKRLFSRVRFIQAKHLKRKIKDGMIIATIRPNNITPLEKDESRSGNVSNIAVNITDFRTTLKILFEKAAGGVDLSEAKVIVSGGSGVKR